MREEVVSCYWKIVHLIIHDMGMLRFSSNRTGALNMRRRTNNNRACGRKTYFCALKRSWPCIERRNDFAYDWSSTPRTAKNKWDIGDIFQDLWILWPPYLTVHLLFSSCRKQRSLAKINNLIINNSISNISIINNSITNNSVLSNK